MKWHCWHFCQANSCKSWAKSHYSLTSSSWRGDCESSSGGTIKQNNIKCSYWAFDRFAFRFRVCPHILLKKFLGSYRWLVCKERISNSNRKCLNFPWVDIHTITHSVLISCRFHWLVQGCCDSYLWENGEFWINSSLDQSYAIFTLSLESGVFGNFSIVLSIQKV